MWAAVAELDKLEKVRLYVSELEPTDAVRTPVPLLRIAGTCWNPVNLVRKPLPESSPTAMPVLPITRHAIMAMPMSSLVFVILFSSAKICLIRPGCAPVRIARISIFGYLDQQVY